MRKESERPQCEREPGALFIPFPINPIHPNPNPTACEREGRHKNRRYKEKDNSNIKLRDRCSLFQFVEACLLGKNRQYMDKKS
jgi:hypothetical protein